MTDLSHVIGSTGVAKKLVDLGDSTYADAVAVAQTVLEDEQFLAGAGSATGRIGTLAISGVMFARLGATDKAYTRAEWLVKSNKAHAVQLYKSRDVVDSVTVTLGTADLDNGDTAVVNGKTFSAHTDTTVCSTGQYAIDGNTAADVVELKKALIPGVSIVPTSADALDTVAVSNGLASYTFTGHATTTTAADGEWDIADDAAAAAGIVLCVNHKDNVTCATSIDDDTVTVNGLVYTSAAAEDLTAREFDNDSSDNDTATSLAACVNDRDTITLASAGVGDQVTISDGTTTCTYTAGAATVNGTRTFVQSGDDTADAVALIGLINDAIYGVPGVTATSALGVVTLIPDFGYTLTMTAGVGGTLGATRIVCKVGMGVPGITAAASSAVVSFTRDTQDRTIALTSSDGTTLAVEAVNGVPGVIAAVSDANEVYVQRTWAPSVSAVAGDVHIVCTDYGLPGCKVTSTATTVVITPDMDSAEPCTCIYAVIGTADANEFTVTNGTLANLQKHGAAYTGVAAITTNLGTLYEQYVDGMPYLYLGFTSEDAAAVSVPVVKATLYA